MIEKLPIFRALVNLLDDEENLLAGLLFAVAGFVAQWQAIGAEPRATLMVGLVAAGFMVLAGFNPVDIAAHIGKRYAHEASMLSGELINVLEKLTGIDFDDRAETAVQLAVEKKLEKLPTNAELAERFEILQSQIQNFLGIGPTAEGGQVIPISQPKSSVHPEPPKSA
jgi:hypothetical protein